MKVYGQYRRRVEEALAYLQARAGDFAPEILVQLGTGLGGVVEALEVEACFAYTEIPGFPEVSVESHAGNLVLARLGGRRLALLQGRFHWYEGYSAREVALPVRVLGLLGVRTAIITNASGGLNPGFSPGTIMIIEDHINLLGDNPLRGPNEDSWGERFPDLSQPYSARLRALARAAAGQLGFNNVAGGTYVCVPGPSLETPAETRYLREAGGDAVGMSSVPEVLVALHAGMEVLGLSVVTNVNDPEAMLPIRLAEILGAAGRAEPRLLALIRTVIAEV
ncbi:MAG: purine-nucleoside phosphorylase [Desulfobulbus propionicus]|nr:MAG: purine-nucleoside phosphorylase [Desulfobulbus propionicus]